MKKQLYKLAFAALAATTAMSLPNNAFAQTGNVGVGVSSPTTKLDLSGALTNRQAATPVTASGTTATIPANLTNSQYQLTGTPTGNFTITGPTNGDASGTATTLQYGARMVLVNNTIYTGTLNGYPIGPKQAVEYVWGNTGTDGWIATNGNAANASGGYTSFCGCNNSVTLTIPAANYTASDPSGDVDIDSNMVKTALLDPNVCDIAIALPAGITTVTTSYLDVQLPYAGPYSGRRVYFHFALPVPASISNILQLNVKYTNGIFLFPNGAASSSVEYSETSSSSGTAYIAGTVINAAYGGALPANTVNLSGVGLVISGGTYWYGSGQGETCKVYHPIILTRHFLPA